MARSRRLSPSPWSADRPSPPSLRMSPSPAVPHSPFGYPGRASSPAIPSAGTDRRFPLRSGQPPASLLPCRLRRIAEPGTASLTVARGSTVSNAVELHHLRAGAGDHGHQPHVGGSRDGIHADGDRQRLRSAGAAVRLGWQNFPATVISATQLTAAIPAAATATAYAPASVAVFYPGSTSNSLQLAVLARPKLRSLNPTSIAAGSDAFQPEHRMRALPAGIG